MMTPQTILVVDDDPGVLETVSLILEEEGYRVLGAAQGETALPVLEMIKPDLIISDVTMPGMDGFKLCEQVRARAALSPIPFIFLTGKGERSDIRKGMALGADDYLVKPFEPEELLSAVRIRLVRAAEARASVDKASADLKRMIVRVLTHELRTPLSLMFGYTELLETMGLETSEEDLQMILHGLHTGSHRLRDLSEGLLVLSRLESGQLAEEIRQMRHVTTEPDEAVRAVVEQFESRAAARGVSLVLHLGGSGATIAVDQAYLAEISQRLVDNAIKFSKKEGGRITLTSRQDGLFWTLEVADDGIGIRQDALGSIFQTFRQVDRDKLEQQGAGLGLAIVRGLAEAFGGRIGVESQPDKGSRFIVYLPLVA
jgi:two-component system sensor histidine kinase/response regulator